MSMSGTRQVRRPAVGRTAMRRGDRSVTCRDESEQRTRRARLLMVEAGATADVLAFLAKGRVARDRATRKLTDVLKRLTNGNPPLDRVRAAWIFGSYARGALDIGDIDLIVAIDEPRSPQQQALQSFYRRAHPYAEIVSALGCGGNSYVNVHVEPVFEPEPQPISPWRKARLERAGGPIGTTRVPELGPMGHTVTGEPFDPQPELVWVRGDDACDIAQRLDAFTPDPGARRYERTTTVAVIDDLLERLGVETAFMLAAQIRQGNLTVRPLLIHDRPVPQVAVAALRARYTERSVRGRALGSALTLLQEEGIDIVRGVYLPGGSTLRDLGHAARRRDRAVPIAIDFNPFLLYKAAAGDLPDDGERHLHIWPSGPRHGPCLALELTMYRRQEALRLYRSIT